MTFTDVLNVATFLGLTPSSLFPLVLLGGTILYVSYRFVIPVKKSVIRITNACIEMQTVMGVGGTQLKHHLTEGPGSPLQPTQYGKKLIEDSGLLTILDNHKEELKRALGEKLSQNPTEYDVQEKARQLLIERKDDALLSSVKQYAYQNGLNVDVILNTGGLWLRDDFLGQARLVKPD